MLSPIIGFIFKLFGWKAVGYVDRNIPKAMWVLAPHRYNSDVLLGIGVRPIVKLRIGFLAKSEVFTWYTTWLINAVGGYPVDRKNASNLVDAVANTFKKNESMHISITPEGTRSDVSSIKTGFYYMALKAGVPIMLCGFEYPTKSLIFTDPIYPTGNYAKDMKPMYDFFLSIKGPKKQWLLDYERTGIVPEARK